MAGSREAALKAWRTMREKGTVPKRKGKGKKGKKKGKAEATPQT